MRILIPITQLPVKLDSIKGGVHSALVNLLSGFSKMEVEIRVVSFSKEVTEEVSFPFSDNINIHYVPEGKYGFHMINYWMNGPKLMRKQILDFNPDFIHFEEGNSFFLVKPREFPLQKTLITIHGFALEEAKRKTKIKDKITWLINGWLHPILTPRNIIHLSTFSKKISKKLRNENTAIIHNAIQNIFFEIPLKTETENKLLYLGIIDNNKNLVFTLGLIHTLNTKGKTYHLDVMGGFSNAEYEWEIREFIKKNNLEKQIYFHGWVNQKQVLEQLNKSDILIVSSKHESLPMAIAEAMAAGKVVLASAVGGIPEMFEDGKSGFLFKLSEPEKAIDTLMMLHNNQNLITEISKEARNEAYQKFHCQHVAKSTLDFYNKILTSI